MADDEARMTLPQGLRAKTEPLQRRGTNVGNENIRGLQQAVECGTRLHLFQVERQRTLVAIEMAELAGKLPAPGSSAEGTQQVTGRRFHFDHFRPVIGEE